MRALALLPLGLLVCLPVPAVSQYLFLDTNGDGVHDSHDRLAPSGPTNVDIWIVTDRNKDGSAASCVGEDYGGGLTLSSYAVVLHAAGGDVKWGPMQNRLPFSTSQPACFATAQDTTDADWYHNGWGWIDQFAPGAHRVATLRIEVLSGRPSIFVEPYLARRPVQITAFGTRCTGYDDDNTFKLGSEWHDADGVGPLRADAGGPYHVQAGRAVPVDGTGSRGVTTAPLSYRWNFDDGATADGAVASHIYRTLGDVPVILNVSEGSDQDADTTVVHVEQDREPVARFMAPWVTYLDAPTTFDGSLSYDPDLDVMTYSWDFGDGARSTDQRPTHSYSAKGVYTVTLRVDDGLLQNAVSRGITVNPVAHPPTARAGGPYAGLMGRPVQFNGSGSSDPDGDALQFAWTFGDRTAGDGSMPQHVYDAPDVYSVGLTVSDGTLSHSASTTATIRQTAPARTFLYGPATFTPGLGLPLSVRLEPGEASFRVEDVAPQGLSMRLDGTTAGGVVTPAGTPEITTDSDGNGVSELSFTFASGDLERLFRSVAPGTTVTAHIQGSLVGGGAVESDLAVQVDARVDPLRSLRITPNPFNPEAVVSFAISRSGPLRADLFDVHGRRVRSVIDGVLPAGPHVVTLGTREGGSGLASGVYFFRLISPDGIMTRRVVVAK